MILTCIYHYMYVCVRGLTVAYEENANQLRFLGGHLARLRRIR